MPRRFSLPVITLVDTVGAWPSFEAEQDGQSEACNAQHGPVPHDPVLHDPVLHDPVLQAIATNLTLMAGLKVRQAPTEHSGVPP